jgi:hypothetical protein
MLKAQLNQAQASGSGLGFLVKITYFLRKYTIFILLNEALVISKILNQSIPALFCVVYIYLLSP